MENSLELREAVKVLDGLNEESICADYADNWQTREREHKDIERRKIECYRVFLKHPQEEVCALTGFSPEAYARFPATISQYEEKAALEAAKAAKQEREAQLKAEREVPPVEYFDKWARETKETRKDIEERHRVEYLEEQACNDGRLYDSYSGRSEESPSAIEADTAHYLRVLDAIHKREFAAFDRVQKFRAQIAARSRQNRTLKPTM